VPNVVKVVTQAIFDAARAAPSMDLRVSGKATADGMPRSVSGIRSGELLDEFRTFGPGTHQRHVTAKNIPQLRKFVDAPTAEPRSEFRAAWIVPQRPHRAESFLGIASHGTKFQDDKPLAAQSHSNLSIKSRPAVSDPDQRSNHRHRRRKQHEGRAGNHDICGPFEGGFRPGDGPMLFPQRLCLNLLGVLGLLGG
jgi:hypothetical protein